jgi:hypothetical protein
VLLVLTILCIVLYTRRAARVADLGVISERWMTQHRVASHDRSR